MNKTVCYYDFEATSVSRDADMISVGLVAVTETDCKKFVLEDLPEHYGNTAEEKINKHLEYLKKGIDIVSKSDYFKDTYTIKTFYAEFTDFNIDKCDDWVKKNIVDKRIWQKLANKIKKENENNIQVFHNTEVIKQELKQWLSQFESIEFWADFDVIDKPMLIDLIADWNYQGGTDGEMILQNPLNYRLPSLYKVGLPKHLPNIRYDQFFDLHTMLYLKGIDTDINREEFIGIKDGMIPFDMQEIRHLGKHNALWDCYVNWKVHQKLMSI